MKKDQLRAIAFEIILIIALLICAFFPFYRISFILTIITTLSAIATSFMLRKKNSNFTNKKQILTIMIVFGILYLALFYTLGLYTGFYHNNAVFDLKNILVYIVPTVITIITTEIMRERLLTVNIRASKILTLIITVLIEINLYSSIYNISKLNDFLLLLGFITFSNTSSNLLYSYLSPKYGVKPIIAYRLIITLYAYIMPVIPDVYVYFRTFCRIIFPLIIYSYLEKYYNPDKELERTKERKRENISFAFASVFMILLIGLVSCRFTYGALVIGSSSMVGELNKGDVVIYKSGNKDLKVGDVIVFKKGNIQVVHRIIKIDEKEKGYQIFTKGDANQNPDEGFITEKDVVGKVEHKIARIGKPTLWLREQFE